MKKAIQMAKTAQNKENNPFSAVLVFNDQIISQDKATDKTTGTVIAHAEINALIKACKKLKTNNLSSLHLYSTNEPCPMCSAALFQAKIANITFGLTREDLSCKIRPRKLNIYELAADSGFPVKIRSGLLRDEILDLQRSWLCKP